MTILSDKQIIDRLHHSVIIDPFVPENVNTSSYDVTLGVWYFIEHKPALWKRIFRRRQIYNIWDAQHVKRVWGEPKQAIYAHKLLPRSRIRDFWNRIFDKSDHWAGIHPDDFVILIPPKHTILAHTREFIGGRMDVTTRLYGEYQGEWTESFPPATTMMKARSSFGRNFIEVCKCAGYGDVGYTNRWTMEITNNSRFYEIPLVVGRRIAQIVFMETGALKGQDYSATGKYQASDDLAKVKAEWTPYMMLPRLDRDRDIQRAA